MLSRAIGGGLRLAAKYSIGNYAGAETFESGPVQIELNLIFQLDPEKASFNEEREPRCRDL
jgi:hypothetical protein